MSVLKASLCVREGLMQGRQAYPLVLCDHNHSTYSLNLLPEILSVLQYHAQVPLLEVLPTLTDGKKIFLLLILSTQRRTPPFTSTCIASNLLRQSNVVHPSMALVTFMVPIQGEKHGARGHQSPSP